MFFSLKIIRTRLQMYIILFYCVYISHAIRLTFLKKAASGSAFVKMFRHPPEKTAVFEVR